jgi:hypothetical protein
VQRRTGASRGGPGWAVFGIRMSIAKDGIDGVRSPISSFVPNQIGDKFSFRTICYVDCSNVLQAYFRIKNRRSAYFLNGDSLTSCAARKK